SEHLKGDRRLFHDDDGLFPHDRIVEPPDQIAERDAWILGLFLQGHRPRMRDLTDRTDGEAGPDGKIEREDHANHRAQPCIVWVGGSVPRCAVAAAAAPPIGSMSPVASSPWSGTLKPFWMRWVLSVVRPLSWPCSHVCAFFCDRWSGGLAGRSSRAARRPSS